MTNETQEQVERERRITPKYVASLVQEGVPLNSKKLCANLKEEGLDFNQRVKFLGEVMDRTMPMIEGQMREEERQYEENPEIEKQYKRKWKPIDFIPALGYFTNDKRNNPLREHYPGRRFYEWANEDFVSTLKSGAFKLYHIGSSALLASSGLSKILYDKWF